MLRRDPEIAVYRDLEKFYRVMGYYEGQEVKPLESHEKFIQQSLEDSLRHPSEYIRRIQYDLNMHEALCQRRIVFSTEKPEASLLYSLFSEGIQSLIALRDLTALDMKDWCLLVRQTLIEFDEGNNKDLATALWRTPSRNIRTRIYNSLLDLEAQLKHEKKDDAEEAPVKWHDRDQEWDLPDGESVQRDKSAHENLKASDLKKVRSHLDSLELNAALPPGLQLNAEEVSLLSNELSAFDSNHVDFNLLNLSLSFLQSSQSENLGAKKYTEKILLNLCQAVVSRFQPSLIHLLIEELKNLDPTRLKDLKEKLEKSITDTLANPANQKRLISSLRDPSRAKVTKKLLPLLTPKQFPAIIDFYLSAKDEEGLLDFLKTIVERDLPLDQIFLGWGEDRLAAVFPCFRDLHWDHKNDFIKRIVRSPYPKLVKQASYYLPSLTFEPDQAVSLYRNLPDETKEVWLNVLSMAALTATWKEFLGALFQSSAWLAGSNSSAQNKLASGWMEVAFKTFRRNMIPWLLPWISGRKFFFWPKYPEAREICLKALVQKKDLREAAEVQELLSREAKVRFQSAELAEQLKRISKQS